MQVSPAPEVGIGFVGLGNVGSGSIDILAQNAEEIAGKLGCRLVVKAVCSLDALDKQLPASLGPVFRTLDWHELVAHPEVEIVAELIGGVTVARELIETAMRQGKSVVTANKELIARHGPELWECATKMGVNLAMEASVAGGIPIHSVLRAGIAADRLNALFGILNGTSNYILTEIEQHGTAFEDVLAEAQRLGYAEANPSADVDGHDAASKLAILGALAFGVRVRPTDIYTEGIRRITPFDFQYAHRLGHTIRLICSAREVEEGLVLSVRPALLPETAILAGVRGSYNAVWVRGKFGQDTFYYGRGAGPHPTGVAVVSDMMRIARELRYGHPQRVSPFAHVALRPHKAVPATSLKTAYYLRFRVDDQPGIIASLAGILAGKHISLDAVLQLPCETKHNLPFVITVEPTSEHAIREAVDEMKNLDFLVEPPLALPMEKAF